MPRRNAAFSGEPGRRYRVGLLTTGFAYGPERRLFEGMLAAARARDVNLLSFHGRRLESPVAADRSANVLYGLVDRQCCDGLVIWSGALGEYVSIEDFRSFCLRFAMPVVTIGGHVLDQSPAWCSIFTPACALSCGTWSMCTASAASRSFEGSRDRTRPISVSSVPRRDGGGGLGLDDQLIVPGDFQREAGSARSRCSSTRIA